MSFGSRGDDSRPGLLDVRSLAMQVTVLGAGAWGTALSMTLEEGGHTTTLWTWEDHHAHALCQDRENQQFLPGHPLPDGLRVTSDLAEACHGAQMLVVVVPSHAVRTTLQQAAPHVTSKIEIVSATKGIEASRLMVMSEVIRDVMRIPEEQVGALSGPSFAKEVAKKVPTNIVGASKSPDLAQRIQSVFSTPWLRVYTSSDTVGVELGGALKNVIAIAAGACLGLGLGDNTRAALITRGVAEMARLVEARGGDRLTMAGLAGVGDLILTCMGGLSRNRSLGYRLGQGLSINEALRQSNGVAEGYVTSRSAVALAEKLGVELPISEAVYSVLHGKKSPQEVLVDLLSRPLHGEWE